MADLWALESSVTTALTPLHHLWPCCIRNVDSAAELRCWTMARVRPVSPLTITVT